MGTRDWQRAEKMLRDEPDEVRAAPRPKSLQDAIDDYLKDCKARHLSEGTICNYRLILGKLAKFLGANASVAALTHQSLSDCRATFNDARRRNAPPRAIASVTAFNWLKYIRSFIRWTVDQGLLKEDPAAKIKYPKVIHTPTQPFSPAEVGKILEACQTPWERAFVLTLLYTGLRIGDATGLRRERIAAVEGQTVLLLEKTRSQNYVKIHPDLKQALARLPDDGPYYFCRSFSRWTRQSLAFRLKRVMKRAGITGRAHQFRDTFAVELLKKGTPIRTVQLLLGHASIVTTEKHYAPWVQAFQQQMDTAVTGLDFGVARKPVRQLKKVS
jgi:site-specific recombinase XerD